MINIPEPLLMPKRLTKAKAVFLTFTCKTKHENIFNDIFYMLRWFHICTLNDSRTMP